MVLLLPFLQDPRTKPKTLCVMCAKGAGLEPKTQPACSSSAHQAAAAAAATSPMKLLRLLSDIDIAATEQLLRDFPEMRPPVEVELVSNNHLQHAHPLRKCVLECMLNCQAVSPLMH